MLYYLRCFVQDSPLIRLRFLRMLRAVVVLCAIASANLFVASPVHAQTLELEPCRITAGPSYPSIKARCGKLLRPENPAAPDSPDITLRVAVVPALNLSPASDVVVPIAGGPGQSTVQFYAAYQFAFEPLRRNRDILLVDQRGTGESSALDCDVDDELITGNFSAETTRQVTADCLAELSHDPRFFTTSVAVTDLEAVRVALGYSALNLYGISYGTRVAQHFARQYPGVTRTIVLDGVVPPQVSLGPEIATESQRAVEQIFERCAADPACHERFPGVAAAFARLVTTLRDAPVVVNAPHPNTGRVEAVTFGTGEFAAAVRLLLYDPNTIALLPLLIHEAANGNWVPLASQYQMTVVSLGESLSMGMHNTIMCSEDTPFYDKTTIDFAGLAASYIGPVQLEAIDTICSVWPAGPVDDEFKVPLVTTIPTLLLSGDADPITPPRYADLAAVDLGNARHLIGKGQGHGQLGVGCMPELLEDFVETANLDALDASCLERAFVMPFFIDFSGPQP
jgi:pimeloyl-ACP methyl ester carboxylesterase